VLLVTAPGPHSVTVRLWGGPAIRVQDNMNRTGGSQAGLPAGREQGRGEDTTRTDGRIHPLVGCRRSALIHGALSSVQRPRPCMSVAVPSRVRHTITRQSPKACAPPKAHRDGTTHSQVELHGYLTGCDTGKRQQATETASTSLPSPLLPALLPGADPIKKLCGLAGELLPYTCNLCTKRRVNVEIRRPSRCWCCDCAAHGTGTEQIVYLHNTAGHKGWRSRERPTLLQLH
jgi:hypothetical protein